MKKTPEEIEAAIERYSRAPFRDILVEVLQASPDPVAIAVFAKRWPDRWAQTCTQVAKLAGYSEKLEIDMDINARVRHMTDAEKEFQEKVAIGAEFIERAMVRCQVLCKQIETRDPEALETAKDVERRVARILAGWNTLTGNKPTLSS